MEQIKLFTSPTCPNCTVLKRLLNDRGIGFTEDQDVDTMQKEGVMSLPTIKTGDTLLPYPAAVNYIREIGVM